MSEMQPPHSEVIEATQFVQVHRKREVMQTCLVISTVLDNLC